jgi:L-threonylcarbamoyladenylate synthase
MRIIKSSLKDISNQAVNILKAGGLIIFPTETCYGAGVDATNQKAVDKLLAYKSRREGRPLSIAVTDKNMASKYVKLNTSALNLYEKFLPGPLTVVSAGKHQVAKGVESETGTLGIRIPDYPLVIEIVKKLGRPITATSANVSYKPRPYSIPQLLKNTSKKQQDLIDLVIDAGSLPQRPVSTIVDTILDDPLLIRQGKIKFKTQTSVVSKSPEETKKLAQTLCLKYWKELQNRPLVFLLIGDLGAGKTQFAKGIGEFLNIKQPITSPTFTIEKEYDYNRHHVRGKFLHLDTWRLQHLEELELLGLDSRLTPKTVVCIEWAGRAYGPLQKICEKAGAKIITLTLQTFAETSPSVRRITFDR